MKCKKCKHEMELEESYTYYTNDGIDVEEHWWCPNCDLTPTRFATYKQIKERWEE